MKCIRMTAVSFPTILVSLLVLNPMRVMGEPSDRVYWASWDTDTIYRTRLDGSQNQELITGQNDPSGITIDEQNGKIYWADRLSAQIKRADLDGSDEEVVAHVNPNAEFPVVEDVAVDPKTNTVYATYNAVINQFMDTAGRVCRMDTDGSGRQDIITLQDHNVGGLAVAPEAKKLYWYDGEIERADTDGTNQQTLYSNVNSLNGLTIDPDSNALYWTRGGGYQTIETGGTDGNGRTTLVTDVQSQHDSLDAPWAIAVNPDDGMMYWTDIDTSRDPFGLYHAEMDGENPQYLRYAYDAYGVAVGPVPEPITGILLALGVIGLLVRRNP